jgi:hypothetical protein
MMDEFEREIAAAALLGRIGGLLWRVDHLNIRPVLRRDSHEISHLQVVKDGIKLNVKVEIDEAAPDA